MLMHEAIINETISLREYFAVLMMIVASGSAYFFMYNAGVTIVIYLISSIILILHSHPIKHFNLFFIVYLFLLLFCLTFNGFNIGVVGFIIYLFSTFFITSSLPFQKFKRVFLNVVIWLSLFSFIFQIIYIFGILSPKLYGAGHVGDLPGHYLIGLHVFGNGQYGLGNRLAGIFWEPGIYQIILNSALIFNIDILLQKDSGLRYRKIKLFIILLAILWTMSTTAYLVLGFIIIGYLVKKSVHSLKFKILTLLGMIIFSVVILLSPIIVEKFSTSNSSFLVRSNDLIGLFFSIGDAPILGTGVGTQAFQNIALKNSLTGSMSAGILMLTVQFGIFWLISYLLSDWKEYFKRSIKIPSLFYMFILICFGLCEPLAYSPVMLIYALPFKNYN